ncbi:hypothetical protein JTB14_010419 [Gonioctena quinquepunctata]|nr:hypothetical protein JTB14_010419 [Gonioctena quinquepunctata]
MESDMGVSGSNDENSVCESVDNNSAEAGTSKIKCHGRSSDVMKEMRLRSLETGPDCGCKRSKCFQVVSKDNAKKIIRDFDELSSYNEQSLYLTGLIAVHKVKNHRPRKKNRMPNSMTMFSHTKLESMTIMKLRTSQYAIKPFYPSMVCQVRGFKIFKSIQRLVEQPQ